MRNIQLLTLLFLMLSCSATRFAAEDKIYCNQPEEWLESSWNKNTNKIFVTKNFITDFDEHYYKCFIEKSSSFLVSKLGHHYYESLPLINKHILDSLSLVKAFEYPVFIPNDSSTSRTSLLFMMNKEGTVLFYRRMMIQVNIQRENSIK